MRRVAATLGGGARPSLAPAARPRPSECIDNGGAALQEESVMVRGATATFLKFTLVDGYGDFATFHTLQVA